MFQFVNICVGVCRRDPAMYEGEYKMKVEKRLCLWYTFREDRACRRLHKKRARQSAPDFDKEEACA